MKEKMPYSVPAGYFESLDITLGQIPCRKSGTAAAAPWICALAVACAAVVLFFGMRAPVEQKQISEQDLIAEYLIETGVPLYYIEETL